MVQKERLSLFQWYARALCLPRLSRLDQAFLQCTDSIHTINNSGCRSTALHREEVWCTTPALLAGQRIHPELPKHIEVLQYNTSQLTSCPAMSSCRQRHDSGLTLLTLVFMSIKANKTKLSKPRPGASISRAAAPSCLQAQACQLLWTTCSSTPR